MNPLIQGLFAKFREAEELETQPSDDSFELFGASLVIPDDILNQTEKTNLLLDSGTVGIDVAVLEINGQIVRDSSDVADVAHAANKIEVALHFLQAKQSHKIDSAQILGFGEAVQAFLNNEGFGKYPQLDQLAEAFRYIFDNYATKLKASPTVFAYFVTTAPTSSVTDQVVQARARSIEKQISELGFLGKVAIAVWGAEELHQAWSKKNNANTVEILLEKQINLPKMPGVDQAILGIVSIAELLKLVQTEDGSLDERIFYDNVRGFKGSANPVNRQMLNTMRSDERDLLPVLNNGVTVVAGAYAPKPGDAVAISDYQVVNGCQTTHCLYLAKEDLGDHIDSTYVPLRIVVTADDEVATKIIRATNSQTAVQENDLVALSNFQKQLEDFYQIDTHDVKLTYERRSGQYYNKEVIKTRVLTISDQMRAISAVALRTPHTAARYANRLYGEVGTSIFKEDHKLLPYLSSAFAAYKLENAFRTGLDSVFKPARYHILMAYSYRVLGKPFSALNSQEGEKDAAKLIAALKKPDQVALFRAAAEEIVACGGGQMPSPDRLKRQQFTQELLSFLDAPSNSK